MIRGILVWLEKNVRKPLEGSYFDQYIASPAKKIYCDSVKQNWGKYIILPFFEKSPLLITGSVVFALTMYKLKFTVL